MINVAERANITITRIQMMVGCALMTEVNIVQSGQNTTILAKNGKEESRVKRSTETRRSQAEINADSQRHYGGLAELPADENASKKFHTPAYQACELIRKSSELFSESAEE